MPSGYKEPCPAGGYHDYKSRKDEEWHPYDFTEEFETANAFISITKRKCRKCGKLSKGHISTTKKRQSPSWLDDSEEFNNKHKALKVE